MAKLLQKMYVVLWKHAVVRIKHFFSTLCEILLPVLFIIVVTHLGQTALPSGLKTEEYESKDADEVLYTSSLGDSDTQIYYAPSTSFTDKLMNSVDGALQDISRTIVGVKNEDDFEHLFNTSQIESFLFIGIIFDDTKDAELPKTLKYRMRAGKCTEFDIGPLQLIIDSIFIDMVRKEARVYNKDLNITRSVQALPYPVEGGVQVDSIYFIFVAVIFFGYLVSYFTVLKGVGIEKESGAKELLKLSGLKTWIYYTCWLIDALFVNLISVTAFVLVMKRGVGNLFPLFPKTDATLSWAFLTMFCISFIIFTFAINSVFEKPSLAVVVGTLLYLAPIIARNYISDLTGISVDRLLCLFPLGGLSQGCYIIMQFETEGTASGLQWSHVYFDDVGYITMADIFMLYFVGIIVFTLITWYMEEVKPGKYGVARPWYFLCTACLRSKNSTVNLETQAGVTENFETPTDNLKVAIRIKNVFKVFTSGRKSESKVALNGVNLDIYHGEITALLGHNGAGKTTLMSIVSGMFSATSGSVMINGYDTRNNMDKIHENLGLCPQHSILIPVLTVEDHLIFFSMLKGVSRKTAKQMSKDILDKLDFADKKHCLPSKLSGGMKRKLSVGIALSGDAEVMILDEPTSGMDVFVRRQVWNLLLSLRNNKTILITTHHMEEADVLGDRVAIMDHGKIKCYGTTLYLKKIYGTGYNLSIIKLDGCKESAVWDTITKNIQKAKIKNLNGPVMHFSLPMDQTSKFSTLFDSLESNKGNLKIGGIGVSVTTLEDVFLNVGEESGGEANESGSRRSETNDDTTHALTNSRVSGLKLIFHQVPALLLNNVLFTYRRWLQHLVTILFALFLTSLPIVSLQNKMGTFTDLTAHVCSLDNYGRTQVFLHAELCPEDIIQSYKKEIESTKSKLTVMSNNPDFNEVLLQEASSNTGKFREKVIVAAEYKCHINSVQAKSMYSGVKPDGFITSVNIMSNALLKLFSNDFSIIFSYQQFKIENEDTFDKERLLVLLALCLALAILFVVSNYVTFPLMERVSESKLIKFMAGVNPITYWLSHFLWDFVCYSITVVTLLIIVVISDDQGLFTQPDRLGVFLMLLILHGCAAIPFVYVFTFLTTRGSGAVGLLVLLNIIFALGGFITVVILKAGTMLGIVKDHVVGITDGVLHLIPLYALATSLFKYAIITIMKIRCIPFCVEDMSYFEGTLSEDLDLRWDIMFFGINWLLFSFILLLIDFGVIKKVYTVTENFIFRKSVVRDDDDDDDVKEEKLRVEKQVQGTESKDALLVYNLVKKYRKFPAVKGISFGVSEGECFGLLGANGAGKTSSFQVLTGHILPNSGKISAFGYKLSKNKAKYLSQIGYCPQFNALDEHLTGNETLTMYAKLRGIPDDLITSETNSWINLLGLNEYCKKACGTYSGGNKRKLSAAIALIGNPPIVFLDEPTTGLDPVSRRKLWSILGKIQKTGQAVVLTSHSMEECEALCTRLAFMVAGQFRCVGNIQHLKQKFGEGFTVTIKIKSSEKDTREVNEVKSWFQEKKFPRICILKDEHLGLLQYQITDPKVTLKQLFTTLEEMKKSFKVVEDYTVSGTTLEQIFLSLAGRNET